MDDSRERNDKQSVDEESIPTASFGPGMVGLGEKIGPYKLLSILGEGGYGIVYLAEQQRPVKRRVALKVIKPGMDTKQVIARFEAERQALALLDHPNIAHVFNAGTTNAGRPYFVMEYVKGVPLTDHCDRHKLTIEERLKLLLQVCGAVQHAHQKGIIHRDIKPSNILISFEGQKAIPRIIDFGVAKAISQSLTERTLVTEQGQLIGTPEYMSPEQAEMTNQDIDTRTDIYSLGVVLYELLTGALPFDPRTFREGGFDHIRHMIREEDPKTPSTRLSTIAGDVSMKVAQLRRTDVRTLGRKLHGDLDWITIKAMEKDRTRRYQTARALVEDIERHLSHEPVLASPPSKVYHLKKFIQKHRTQVVGTSVAGILLAVITVISVMYIRAINRGKEAESIGHEGILSKAMEFRSMGRFDDALTGLDPILNSEYVGPAARLLHARLVLQLQGPANAIKELEMLLDEEDKIAGQAHFLLAQIYYESDPDAPGRTDNYRLKWEHHRQEAEKLLPQSPDTYLLQAMASGTVPKTLTLLNKALKYDERHYDSLRERAYLSYAGKSYYKMAKDAATMIGIQPNNPAGYLLSAVAQRELGQFDEAIKDHNKAIERSPNDPELYDHRRQTYARLGNYKQALLDARKCVELQPEETIYHFHAFCALVALGHYDEATVNYDRVFNSDSKTERQFRSSWSRRYVFDTLSAGRSWHPTEREPPQSGIFLAMYEADEEYRHLADRAKLVVAEGFHPNWSPDGTELVYSRGVVGSSGIEILHLESQRTRLLTTPGKDPDWSPDGQYIAYVRDRQILPVGYLIDDRDSGKHGSYLQEEVWLVKADGTEEPRFMARGGWPCWSSDSKRIFYHDRLGHNVRSISIEDGAEPVTIIRCSSYYPAVSPDEKYVAYEWGGELRIVELSSKSVVTKRALPSPGFTLIGWSPDGQKLSLPSYSDSLGLFVYDIEKDEISCPLSGSFARCRWSPAETEQIAIATRHVGAYGDIWIADAALLASAQTPEEHYQKMVSNFTRRIANGTINPRDYLSRARYYYYLKEDEEALADLERYSDLVKDPSRIAGAYGGLGFNFILYQVDPEIAIELCRRAHKTQPGMWTYLCGLGAAYCWAGQWAEAIIEFTKSTKLPDGENAFNYFGLSMASWQLREKENGIDWYNKAIEWIQNSNVYADPTQAKMIDFFYFETAQLLGVKIKGFSRKMPLTGAQIPHVTIRTDNSDSKMKLIHVVDVSGLADVDADGLFEHDENPENMWLSEQGRTSGWIEFDMGDVYELGSILVWNYNERGHTQPGIKRADVSVWTQDKGWQKVFDNFDFAEAEGSFDYDEPILLEFDAVKTQKVRFDDLATFGDEEHLGLSEIQFFEKRRPSGNRTTSR